MKNKLEQATYDLMHKDPENWKLGIFYVNHKDSRVIVPKRNPYMGWTLNFGNIWAYLSIVAIAAAIIVSSQLFS